MKIPLTPCLEVYCTCKSVSLTLTLVIVGFTDALLTDPYFNTTDDQCLV